MNHSRVNYTRTGDEPCKYGPCDNLTFGDALCDTHCDAHCPHLIQRVFTAARNLLAGRWDRKTSP